MNIGDWGWLDLTVEDADARSRFYEKVCGWTRSDHDMGGYSDFDMATESGKRVAGICHARGENAALPAQWMPYVVVADLNAALETAIAEGGSLMERRGRLAFVRDPGGACFGLWAQDLLEEHKDRVQQ